MSNTKYFQENQLKIREMLSTEFGTSILGKKISNDIKALITPNSVHWIELEKDGKFQIKARYFGVETFAKHFIPVLTQLEIAEHEYKPIDSFKEAILHFAGTVIQPSVYPSVYLAIETFYVDSGDGDVKKSVGTGTSWASLRSATSGDSVDYSGDTMTLVSDNNCGGNSQKRIWRGWFSADISSFDPAGEIVSAKLSIKASNSTGSAQSMCLEEGTQASTTSLVTADYNNVNAVELAPRISSLPGAGNRMEFALNASGLSLLTVTPKYCIRFAGDVDNVEPSSGTCAYQSYYTSNKTGTDDDPYLEITYTLPSGGGSPLFFNQGGFALG